MKLECVTCHTPAPESKVASDNLLPAQTACARCHDRAMPIGEPRRLTVTKFNHQRHLGFGSVGPVIAAAIKAKTYHNSTSGAPPDPALEGRLASAGTCTACHRGMELSERVDGANFPVMQDCLVCHPSIDNPFSCEKCHDAGPHLKPASHSAPAFMDQHSTGRAGLNKLTCVVCHGKGFRCMGCHG